MMPAAKRLPTASKKKPAATARSTKTKPPAQPAGPPGLAPPELVDKALKVRWDEAIVRYRKARAEELEGWDERYEALGDILDSDPPYYLAGGYRTARAFLQAEVPDQDERSVRTYIRVARYFDPPDEQQYGIIKLDLLLRYMESTGALPLEPAKIRPDRQKVRVTRGRTTQSVPLAEVTFEELRAATRAAARSAGKPQKNAPPLVRALSTLLSKAKLQGVGVRLRGGKVDLSGIPADRLGALGSALASADLPACRAVFPYEREISRPRGKCSRSRTPCALREPPRGPIREPRRPLPDAGQACDLCVDGHRGRGAEDGRPAAPSDAPPCGRTARSAPCGEDRTGTGGPSEQPRPASWHILSRPCVRLLFPCRRALRGAACDRARRTPRAPGSPIGRLCMPCGTALARYPMGWLGCRIPANGSLLSRPALMARRTFVPVLAFWVGAGRARKKASVKQPAVRIINDWYSWVWIF
jgi:hypothetical protein